MAACACTDAFGELWASRRKPRRQPESISRHQCARLYHDRNVWRTSRAASPILAGFPPAGTGRDAYVQRPKHHVDQPAPAQGATLIAFMDVTADPQGRDGAEGQLTRPAAAATASRTSSCDVTTSCALPSRPSSLCRCLKSERPGELTDKAARAGRTHPLRPRPPVESHLQHLDLAMIEAGKMRIELFQFCAGARDRGRGRLVVTTAENTKVRFEILCDDRIGNISADERRINQGCSTAHQCAPFTGAGATSDRPRSRFRARTSSAAVSDNGKGIAPDASPRLDSFTTGDTRAQPRLALVRSFVELHAAT